MKMNQILSFKKFLIGKVLDGSKDLTTRISTPYRLKMNVGDIAYIYTGIRTKDAKKHAEAVITNRWVWNQYHIDCAAFDCIHCEDHPILEMPWQKFTRREGFKELADMIDWFTQKNYIDKDLITYEFKLLKTMEAFLE